MPPHSASISNALTDTQSTALGRQVEAQIQRHPNQTGMRLLPDGVEAFLARIFLAKHAERSLDLQYYIWRGDMTGRLLSSELLDAADRGVRIRVLIDDVGTGADDQMLLDLDSHPNIDIRLFNPLASRRFRSLGMLSDFSRINRRMHNKAFIADNQVAVLGGRNIGDEYFDASAEVSFGDLDVLSIGPVVPQISAAFDDYWNGVNAYPISLLLGREAEPDGLSQARQKLAELVAENQSNRLIENSRQYLEKHQNLDEQPWYWGQAYLVVDDPAKVNRSPESREGRLITQFSPLGLDLTQELFIVSPYFVPGDAGVDWIRNLRTKGIQVSVLTNSLAATDVLAVHSGYQRYREELLKAGVHIYELKPKFSENSPSHKHRLFGSSRASLHAKTFVFDRSAVFIGSMNLDPRSIALNTEIGLVCKNSDMANDMLASLATGLSQNAWELQWVETDGSGEIHWIDHQVEGDPYVTDEPEVSGWRRFKVWMLGLLPVESLL